MKLLDKYILYLFVKNYLISLTVLIGMFVVMDLVFHFDNIVKVETKTPIGGITGVLTTLVDIGDFYFYQCFAIFVQLSGIIPVVAAAFTFMRLSRFSELTAFLAAGVPMMRLAMPVLVTTVLLNVLVIVDQELVLPGMIPKLERTTDELHQTAGKEFPIKAMQVDQHSVLVAAQYDPVTRRMRDLDVIERNQDLVPSAHLLAATAQWNNATHQWDLTGGRRVQNLLPGESRSDETAVAAYNGSVTPDEIDLYKGSASVEFLSTSKINQLIARPKSYGVAGLYKIKNLRVTQPFMNIVLLLLAIPAVMTFDPKTLKSAATKCLLMMGLAMSSVFVCQQIAGKPPLGDAWFGMSWISTWPALMSWMPIFLFTPVSIWFLDRMKT